MQVMPTFLFVVGTSLAASSHAAAVRGLGGRAFLAKASARSGKLFAMGVFLQVCALWQSLAVLLQSSQQDIGQRPAFLHELTSKVTPKGSCGAGRGGVRAVSFL